MYKKLKVYVDKEGKMRVVYFGDEAIGPIEKLEIIQEPDGTKARLTFPEVEILPMKDK